MNGAIVPPHRSVPIGTRIGFGVGDFGFLVVWQGTTLFLMYFCTDVMGLDPVLAGTIYLVAMVWDALTDPVIATLAERTRTRWGAISSLDCIGGIALRDVIRFGVLNPGRLARCTLAVGAGHPSASAHSLYRRVYAIQFDAGAADQRCQ